jgi:hemoglobin
MRQRRPSNRVALARMVKWSKRVLRDKPMNMVHSPRAGISQDDIAQLVGAFYPRVRADTRLGPIFEGRIGTSDAIWAKHMATIGDFWANVMLRERAYKGNPLQVHLGIPDIEESDFARWLDLFEDTARRELGDDKADVFNTLARRIGRSLWMGIDMQHNPLAPRS